MSERLNMKLSWPSVVANIIMLANLFSTFHRVLYTCSGRGYRCQCLTDLACGVSCLSDSAVIVSGKINIGVRRKLAPFRNLSLFLAAAPPDLTRDPERADSARRHQGGSSLPPPSLGRGLSPPPSLPPYNHARSTGSVRTRVFFVIAVCEKIDV